MNSYQSIPFLKKFGYFRKNSTAKAVPKSSQFFISITTRFNDTIKGRTWANHQNLKMSADFCDLS